MENDIAVIGIGMRIAQCTTTSQYRNKLLRKELLHQRMEGKRLRDLRDYVETMNLGLTELSGNRNCFLKEIDMFDYSLFNISLKEAQFMDPNQRLMLQTVYDAVIDSGVDYQKTNTSVFIGYTEKKDYEKLIDCFQPDMKSFAMPGNLTAAISGRLSYTFDWSGNNLLMDAGDSSSALALKAACDSLNNREADMAVAGGIDLNILPFNSESKTPVMEEKGECVAAVLLKPLSAALNDKSPIYGVIKASVSNRNGKSNAYDKKRELLLHALLKAKIGAEEIEFVESTGITSQQDIKIINEILTFPEIDMLSYRISGLNATSSLQGLIHMLLMPKEKTELVGEELGNQYSLLVHFGKDGGNSCIIVKPKERKLKMEQQSTKAKRCWIKITND